MKASALIFLIPLLFVLKGFLTAAAGLLLEVLLRYFWTFGGEGVDVFVGGEGEERGAAGEDT